MTETDGAPEAAVDAESGAGGDRERPTFRGCVACYAAEWVAYVVRGRR